MKLTGYGAILVIFNFQSKQVGSVTLQNSSCTADNGYALLLLRQSYKHELETPFR